MDYKIASFDIGIKNLSFCVLKRNPQNNFDIFEWQNLDITPNVIKCSFCQNYKNGKTKTCTKNALMYRLDENSNKIGFCTIHAKKQKEPLKRIQTASLQDLCLSMIDSLNKFPILMECKHIIMEQQPSKNPSMKNLSMMIFSYFAHYLHDHPDGAIEKIDFVNSKNKLKTYTGPEVNVNHLKNDYDKRKHLSVEYTKHMLQHNKDTLQLMLNHKKQSDLADCFLQGVWYIQNVLMGSYDKMVEKFKGIKSKQKKNASTITMQHLKHFVETYFEKNKSPNKEQFTEYLEKNKLVPTIEKYFHSMNEFIETSASLFNITWNN